MKAKDIVLSFWESMRSNDFAGASKWLTEDFEGDWPQSSELISGRDNFIAINTEYPANGRWEFTLNSIVCEGDIVVTDVSVSDGEQQARAITFHTVKNDLICRQVEFWPDNYDPPKWRSRWVKSY